MITNARTAVLFLVPVVFAVPAKTQEPDFNPLGREVPIEALSAVIRIQLEWIEIDHADLTELIEDDAAMRNHGHLSTNAGPMREALQEMIEKRKATLLDTSILNARSGQRAKVESILEYIYPTEYDPPGMLVTGEEETTSVAKSFSYLPQATAFEVRNLGTTVEVDPVLGADSRTIDLNLAPEIVYLADTTNYGTHVEGKSEVEITMPSFYTIKTTTQVTLMDGEPFFLGAHGPFNEKEGRVDQERRVLIFVKADLLYAGLPLAEEDEED